MTEQIFDDSNELCEMIDRCEKLEEYNKNFNNFQNKCAYNHEGCEDGVWLPTCRYKPNIPYGYSWGDCKKDNCPRFKDALDDAKGFHDIARWLKELQDRRNAEEAGDGQNDSENRPHAPNIRESR